MPETGVSPGPPHYESTSAFAPSEQAALLHRRTARDGGEDDMHPQKEETKDLLDDVAQEPSQGEGRTQLHRSMSVFILVSLYAALAILAWSITWVLSFRPIAGPKGPNKYGVLINTTYENANGNHENNYHAVFITTEHWFRAATIMQAILMTLADKGWTAPPVYARLMMDWKRYGTSFLVVAIVLNVLGGLIAPLQQIFLSSETIKTPVNTQRVDTLMDIPDQWFKLPGDTGDSGFVVAATRNALKSSSNVDPQSQLWQGVAATCNMMDLDYTYGYDYTNPLPPSCGKGNSLGDFANLKDPFLAELPSAYSTGLIRQYLPRINSTAVYKNVTAGQYPKGCDQIPGAYYVAYSAKGNTTPPETWSIEVCMPADMSMSPWKSTRDRQDFSEVMYLNVTLSLFPDTQVDVSSDLYQVVLNTTAGYFELPNYMNDKTPGPLLEKDPRTICGADCQPQWDSYSNTYSRMSKRNVTSQTDDGYTYTSNEPNSTLNLETLFNKGPLLTTAIALFGSGSFLETRVAQPAAYEGIGMDSENSQDRPPNYYSCIDMVPLGRLFADASGNIPDFTSMYNTCIHRDGDVFDGAINWIEHFRITNSGWIAQSDRLSNVFTAAAFLANQAWIENNPGRTDHTLSVTFDQGADTLIPSISVAGIIIVSVLLGIFLMSLFVMASYASISPRWTDQLDSFAMMRIGASIADQVPLKLSDTTHKMSMLDDIPGCIGDSAGENSVGRFTLGGETPLTRDRHYECF